MTDLDLELLLLEMAGRDTNTQQLQDLEDYMSAFFDVCVRYGLRYSITYHPDEDVHTIQVSDTKGLSLTHSMKNNKYGRPMIVSALLHMAKQINDTWYIIEKSDNVLQFKRK